MTDRAQVEDAVAGAVERLGGLDVVIANAGVAAPLPLVGGDPAIFERTIAVNLLGVYYTLRAAGPHISHARGYALPIASLAAAVHAPMLGAYSASKAAVEALGDTLRTELHHTGARVGVAYFAFIDTDMVKRGFETRAARQVSPRGKGRTTPPGTVPLKAAIDAIERGVERRSRRVTAPRWVDALLPLRMLAQPLADIGARRGLQETLALAREEHAPLTTAQPGEAQAGGGQPAGERADAEQAVGEQPGEARSADSGRHAADVALSRGTLAISLRSTGRLTSRALAVGQKKTMAPVSTGAIAPCPWGGTWRPKPPHSPRRPYRGRPVPRPLARRRGPDNPRRSAFVRGEAVVMYAQRGAGWINHGDGRLVDRQESRTAGRIPKGRTKDA